MIPQFIHKEDLSCILKLSLYAPLQAGEGEGLGVRLYDLFGGRIKLSIRENLKADEGKIIPCVRE